MSSFLDDAISIGTFGLIDGGDITGSNQAAAAQQAAAQQAAATDRSIALQRETRDIARSDLEPYRNFGMEGVAPLNNMLTSQGQYDFVANNPLFNAAIENTGSQLKNMGAASGKFNSGGMVDQLFKNYLATSQGFIQPQINNLFNRVNMGQSAAAGQANTALSTGSSISNLLGQQGDIAAAGIVGAQNARTGAFNNLLNFGGSIAGGMSGGGYF